MAIPTIIGTTNGAVTANPYPSTNFSITLNMSNLTSNTPISGDVLYAFVYRSVDYPTPTFNVPSGWTEIHLLTQGDNEGSSSREIHILSKKWAAGDSSFTFSSSDATTYFMQAHLVLIRNSGTPSIYNDTNSANAAFTNVPSTSNSLAILSWNRRRNNYSGAYSLPVSSITSMSIISQRSNDYGYFLSNTDTNYFIESIIAYADASALSSSTIVTDSSGNNLNAGFGPYNSVADSVVGTRMYIPYLNTAPPVAPNYNLIWKSV
jgi:hypothetical protein